MKYKQDPARVSRQTSLSSTVQTILLPLIIKRLLLSWSLILQDKVCQIDSIRFDCCEFHNFAKDFQFEHIKTSPRYHKSSGKAKKQWNSRKLRTRAMIQICLHLSLEAHHHKEFIFLQHSVSSIKGIAPYCPSLEKFFRKMLFIKWHRNCNARTTSKLFTMTQELWILPLLGHCK